MKISHLLNIVPLLFFSGCLSTLPITQGPDNLERGQVEVYSYCAINVPMNYDWFAGIDDEYFSVLSGGLGVNYGLFKTINTGMFVWGSLVADIGGGPVVALQLLRGKQNLNLILKGGIGYAITNSNPLLIAVPSIVWGPCKYFFIGLQHEYRSYSDETETNYDAYNRTMGHIEKDEWKIRSTGIYIGSNCKPAFRKVLIYGLIRYEHYEKIWQLSFGGTYRFFRK